MKRSHVYLILVVSVVLVVLRILIVLLIVVLLIVVLLVLRILIILLVLRILIVSAIEIVVHYFHLLLNKSYEYSLSYLHHFYSKRGVINQNGESFSLTVLMLFDEQRS